MSQRGLEGVNRWTNGTKRPTSQNGGKSLGLNVVKEHNASAKCPKMSAGGGSTEALPPWYRFTGRTERLLSVCCWRSVSDMLKEHTPKTRRPSGMTPDRIRKRYIIATCLIVGLKVVDIARQIGVARSWASREANSAGVRNIIDDAFRENWGRVREFFSQALTVIREALEARRTLRRNGRIVQGGPDYRVRFKRVRFKAVRTFIKLANVMGTLCSKA